MFKILKAEVKTQIENRPTPQPFQNAVTFLKKRNTPSKLELMAEKLIKIN